jgi:Acetyltransferase (GNAT) domain
MLQISYLSELSIDLLEEWNNLWLEVEDTTIFNSPKWFEACRQAFPLRNQIIVVAKAENRLGAVILIEKQKNWTLMGRPYMDRASLLIAPDFAMLYGYQILSNLLKRFKILDLSELSEHQSRIFLSISDDILVCQFQSSLNPKFAIKQPALSNKEKREIRRLTQRLSERGDWSIELQTLSNDTLSKMCSIEQLSHKVSNKQAVLHKPEVKELFTSIAYLSNTCIAFLIQNGKPIAHLLGLIDNKIFLAYHMAYDETWAAYAPGKLLIYHILPYLEEEGFLYFDFSRGESSIKSKFSNIVAKQYNLVFFRKNCLGYIYFLLWQASSMLDVIRLKLSLHLSDQWKIWLRYYFKFWLDRRK